MKWLTLKKRLYFHVYFNFLSSWHRVVCLIKTVCFFSICFFGFLTNPESRLIVLRRTLRKKKTFFCAMRTSNFVFFFVHFELKFWHSLALTVEMFGAQFNPICYLYKQKHVSYLQNTLKVWFFFCAIMNKWQKCVGIFELFVRSDIEFWFSSWTEIVYLYWQQLFVWFHIFFFRLLAFITVIIKHAKAKKKKKHDKFYC